MDYGHARTEERLIGLERKIKREYTKAFYEIKATAEEYLKRFEAQDTQKQNDVKDGKISQSDYVAWRQGKMQGGERYKAMIDNMAHTMNEANQATMSMINDSSISAYAFNFNYAGYEVSKKADAIYPFTLVDENTVKRLLRDNTIHLPRPKVNVVKDLRWNRKKLNSALTQGILQGESIPKIAKRLQGVSNMNRSASIRNARTLTTGAENGGRLDRYKEAQAMGIPIMKKWEATLDHVTRDSHVDVDGEVQEIDHPFSNGLDYPGGMGPPEEVYNCFVAETSVGVDSEILRGYKHWYDGEVVSIKTASGVNFTCTPNHPILTPRGWVKANLLNNGQDLLVTVISDKHLPWRNPNINHVFARFDTLFKLLEKIGGKRTCALGVNFHGDIATTNVEIIAKEGFLRSYRDSIGSKECNKFLLKSANKSLVRKSTFMKHFGGVRLTTFSFISRLNKALSFFTRSMSHSVIHSLRPISRNDAIFLKSQNDAIPSDSELFCKSLDRLTRVVFADKIIDINIDSFHGYVYNLQTENNYYFVNSILSHNGIYAIAHNCRCTMVSEIKGHNYSNNRLSKLGSMSYDQWKRERGTRGTGPVNGKDITSSWKYNSKRYPYQINSAVAAQGFNGLPAVMGEKDFNKAVENSNLLLTRTYGGITPSELERYRSDLISGEWYINCKEGGSAYGSGMYTAGVKGITETEWLRSQMKGYSDKPLNTVDYMTLRQDAKIITLKELAEKGSEVYKNLVVDYIDKQDFSNIEKEFLKFTNTGSLNASYNNQFDSISISRKQELYNATKKEILSIGERCAEITKDNGVFATLLGYDAIEIDQVNGYYYLILNRTKVIIRR